MSCAVCKFGTPRPGFTSVTLERDDSVVVIQNVPAEICETCGEYYLEAEVAEAVYALAEEVLRKGEQVAVAKYAA
ncbi:MAG: type II toxin-antitoxin system MqsA family antitoxin [Alphaproteobacteria bacterium]|nr:type II toxin-antitoxin system MqsA family antitoxin [Alphaproteobacteria bacterium]